MVGPMLFDNGGNMYVPDPGRATVHVFDRTFHAQRRFRIFPLACDEPEAKCAMSSVAWAADTAAGRLYVADLTSGRMQCLDMATGVPLGQWQGAQGELAIALDEGSGEVHLIDYKTLQVSVFTSTGARVRTWPAGEEEEQRAPYPCRRAFHILDGRAYLLDGRQNAIRVMTLEGSEVARIASRRHDEQSDPWLEDVAIDRRHKLIYVTVLDTFAGCVEAWTLAGVRQRRWAIIGRPVFLTVDPSGFVYGSCSVQGDGGAAQGRGLSKRSVRNKFYWVFTETVLARTFVAAYAVRRQPHETSWIWPSPETCTFNLCGRYSSV